MTPAIPSGSTAWMLASTALVLLMTPGLAFFYGGMTRAKTTLNMMMMSWIAIVTVTIAWVLYGDSLTFGKGNWFIGGFEYLGEHGLVHSASRVAGIPDLLFSAFQLTFAVITVALISGHAGVLPGRPLGLGRRLAQQPGYRGLRRRHGRARQRRLRGSRPGARARQAAALAFMTPRSRPRPRPAAGSWSSGTVTASRPP
jgi:hypothetical protein